MEHVHFSSVHFDDITKDGTHSLLKGEVLSSHYGGAVERRWLLEMRSFETIQVSLNLMDKQRDNGLVHLDPTSRQPR